MKKFGSLGGLKCSTAISFAIDPRIPYRYLGVRGLVAERSWLARNNWGVSHEQKRPQKSRRTFEV